MNCQFHNMPGARACGRCSSPLGLTAAIDVHPPRAGRMAKGVRRLTGSRRPPAGVWDRWAIRRETFRAYTDQMPPGPVLARFVVPGWPQWAAGQRWQGHVFFWTYVVLTVLGLLWVGSTLSGILLGLAFSVHAWSIVDVVNQTFTDRRLGPQLSRSIAASILLGIVLYWPASLLLGRVAAPYTMNYSGGDLRAGDVLLGSTLLSPSPGRVVMYEIPRTSVPGQMREGGRYTVFEGQRIDRVLAGPGDQVLCRGGSLNVNGQPAPQRPLDSAMALPDLAMTVPPGKLFIVPSTTARLLGDSSANTLQQASLVDADRVQAVIYARTQPFRRFRLFH